MYRTLRFLSLAVFLLVSGYTSAQGERVINSNFEGTDYSSFLYCEKGAVKPVTADNIVVDADDANNHCVKIVSVENSTATWDSQFIISLGEPLSQGDWINFSMRAKASKPIFITSQAQVTPCNFLHWDMVGNYNITTEWKNLTYTCTISAEQEGCTVISFLLNEANDKTSTEFYFDDISVEVTKKEELDYPISFADEAVKAVCVENWDTDGDSELSYAEAAAVTDLGEAFKYNRQITSFDELQHFIGLKSIGYSAFNYCTNLMSVTIPSNVTSIGEYAFANCSGLTSVTISEGVTSIGSSAFSFCTNLTSVSIPSSVTSIGENAFGYGLTKVIVSDIAAWCGISFGDSSANPLYFAQHIYSDENTEITKLVIPSSVTSIGDWAFCNCSGLTSVTISEGVTSIGSSAFSFCCSLTSVAIPSSVMSIGSYAFGGSYGLSSVTVDEGNGVYDSRNNCNAIIETATNTIIMGCLNTVIPESVTSIGDNVFSGCTGLMSVTIPSSVTSIGNSAFSGCSNLLSINLPPNLEFIGRSAFSGCANIADFNIPNTVTHIGSDAFSGTGITTLTIPKSVIEIESNINYGYSPAARCTNLESIFVEEGNPAFMSENGVLFNKDKTILMCYPAGKSDDKYIMPNTVTIVGAGAFNSNKHLMTVTLSRNLEIIGDGAFIWCSGLRDIYSYIIPDESDEYDLGFGYGINIFLLSTDWNNPIVPTLHVPVGCKQYYEQWSLWNWMNIVEMEDTNIEFADPAVKAICVANWDTNGDGELSYDEAAAVTDLGEVFKNNLEITSFDELQYFTGLMTIGYPAFANCTGLTSVTIPEGVTSIGQYAFYGCYMLAKITFAESVTSIENEAFYGCTSLTSVTIPKGVTSIGLESFFGCPNLESITVASGNAVFDSREDCNAIIETGTNTLIAGCQSTVIPNSVTCIGPEAFYCCYNLTSITIPESVTNIGDWAFRECSSLTSVTLNEGLTNIGDMAFAYCESLTSINIPSSVANISGMAFCGCSGLTSVTIPEGVTNIGDHAFWQCTGLTSVTIPSSVTSIGDGAFNACSSLTSITIPSSVTSIGEYVFYGSSLTEVISLMEEPFYIDESVFSVWDEETQKAVFTTATLYVPAGTKEKYLATPAWNLFLNIVEMGLEPVEQGETVDFGTDISEDTNIDGNTVGDIYYSISSGDGSYDPSEGCIVVTSPTDDETVSGVSGTDIFGEDFNAHFTGVVFKVAPGKGTIRVEAQTTGNMVLKVKIGDGDPITMELEGKLKVSFPYNVSEETYVYIYGGENSAAANGMRFAPATGSLKIYGIEVESVTDGIETATMIDDDSDAPVYNLNGQRVNTPHRGIYIQNGKKVLVK